MERLYFVVNPVAGSGNTRNTFDIIRTELEKRGVEYGFAYTEYEGHATLLAKEAVERGEKYVISVGGDGTANEVASAMVNTGAVMGILPFGTGNDLSKSLGIPSDPAGALDMILNGRQRSMDAGSVNGSIFINASGIGFDVDVLLNTEQFKRRFSGMVPYFMGILKSLAGTSFPHAVIKDDSGRVIDCEVLIIIIGNGTCFGGGMKATPLADPFDGLFDVCVVRRITKLRLISLLLCFIKGKHVGLEPVEYFRAKELNITCTPKKRVQIDGNVCLETPAEYRLLPSAINMLVK